MERNQRKSREIIKALNIPCPILRQGFNFVSYIGSGIAVQNEQQIKEKGQVAKSQVFRSSKHYSKNAHLLTSHSSSQDYTRTKV